MNKIQLLHPGTIGLIAAGEVIHSPRDVLKELIENSIDANATRLSIDLSLGGIEKIVVKDDGHGIASDQMLIALERYATSKLRGIEDLNSLYTYGFRGEALFSISHVSNFLMRSKIQGATLGHQVEINTTTREPKETSVSMDFGTEVIVAQLFAPIPIRRKFLKNPRLEQHKCLNLIKSLAIINPHVDIICKNDGQLLLSIRKSNQDEIIKRLTEIFHVNEEDWISQSRLIDQGEIKLYYSKKNTKGSQQHWFINKRWIDDPQCKKLALNYFSEGILVVICDIRLELVDVNIHPQKWQVGLAQFDGLLASLSDFFSETFPNAAHKFEPEINEAKKTLTKNINFKSNIASEILSTQTNSYDLKKILSEKTKNKNEDAFVKNRVNIISNSVAFLFISVDKIILFNPSLFVFKYIRFKYSSSRLFYPIDDWRHSDFLDDMGFKAHNGKLISIPKFFDFLKIELFKDKIYLWTENESWSDLLRHEFWTDVISELDPLLKKFDMLCRHFSSETLKNFLWNVDV